MSFARAHFGHCGLHPWARWLKHKGPRASGLAHHTLLPFPNAIHSIHLPPLHSCSILCVASSDYPSALSSGASVCLLLPVIYHKLRSAEADCQDTQPGIDKEQCSYSLCTGRRAAAVEHKKKDIHYSTKCYLEFSRLPGSIPHSFG